MNVWYEKFPALVFSNVSQQNLLIQLAHWAQPYSACLWTVNEAKSMILSSLHILGLNKHHCCRTLTTQMLEQQYSGGFPLGYIGLLYVSVFDWDLRLIEWQICVWYSNITVVPELFWWSFYHMLCILVLFDCVIIAEA